MSACALVLLGTCLLLSTCGSSNGGEEPELDLHLRTALASHGIQALQLPAPAPKSQVELGRLLFFDKVLSGNKDTSCATCHNLRHGTSDGLSTSIGTGGSGSGPARRPGPGRPVSSRNSMDLFNRGDPRFREMFWDGRVNDDFLSPIGSSFKLDPPASLALAQQALFPVLADEEQKGQPGDIAVDGTPNELAAHGIRDPFKAWELQLARLMELPGYQAAFAGAYPEHEAEFTIGHLVNAIAAFEISAFSSADSPFDSYLAGNDSALSPGAKRGALLFYGKAGCVRCHAGNLFTDFSYHSLAVPQVGPGRGPSAQDRGRQRVLLGEDLNFAFRTPPLRNVELTGPYMHDGCYASLEDAVRHHLDPLAELESYDPRQLSAHLQGQVLDDPEALQSLRESLSPLLASAPNLSDADVSDLLAFLRALTGDGARNLEHLIPASVPSGLPVED